MGYNNKAINGILVTAESLSHAFSGKGEALGSEFHGVQFFYGWLGKHEVPFLAVVIRATYVVMGNGQEFLMYPFARIGDKILDWLDPAMFKYTISYTKN